MVTTTNTTISTPKEIKFRLETFSTTDKCQAPGKHSTRCEQQKTKDTAAPCEHNHGAKDQQRNTRNDGGVHGDPAATALCAGPSLTPRSTPHAGNHNRGTGREAESYEQHIDQWPKGELCPIGDSTTIDNHYTSCTTSNIAPPPTTLQREQQKTKYPTQKQTTLIIVK